MVTAPCSAEPEVDACSARQYGPCVGASPEAALRDLRARSATRTSRAPAADLLGAAAPMGRGPKPVLAASATAPGPAGLRRVRVHHERLVGGSVQLRLEELVQAHVSARISKKVALSRLQHGVAVCKSPECLRGVAPLKVLPTPVVQSTLALVSSSC